MSPITERLGWVLIHSLWQFCLLSAIAFAFQRILRRARPEIRYAGLLCALGLVLIVPLTTWTLQSEPSAAAQTATSESAGGSIGPPEVLPQDRDDRRSSVGRNSPQIVVPTADSTEPALTETDGRIAQSRTDPPQPTLREAVQVKLKPWLPTIVLGWSIGVLMFAVRPVWSLITIRRLRRQGISAVPENVSALLASTAKRLGVSCAIEVWQSAVVQVPIVAGYLKPVILLPVSVVSGLPASQLEAILAHELAHIRRHDYLVNLLQTLVETICFYHPAVWWLSYQIRCEREHCCDDIAVRALGSPLHYSRALLALEEMRVVQTPLAVGAGGGSLLTRVRRLLPSETRHGSQTPGGIAVVGSLLACVLTLAIITTSRESSVEAADERVSFPSPSAESSSWPQLGGSASHNPVSSATGLPTQFDVETRQNIRWSAEIGSWSYSSPVVADGKVLIGANNALGRDPRFPSTVDMACLQCFDEATGEFLWQFSSPRMEQGRRHDWPELSICSTPVVEGDRVWFVTNRCEIICLDLNGHRDGEDDGPELEVSVGKPPYVTSHVADVVWRFDLFNELGVRPLNATCVTPTIAGQLLLLNAPNDVDESYQSLAAPDAPAFLAFDKSAGKLIWSDRTPNSGIIGSGCSMGAPAVGQIEGAWQVVFGGYDGWLYSFDLEGIIRGETKLLWKFDVNPKTATFLLSGPRVGTPVRGVAFTPVISGNHVYAAVGHNPEQGNGSGRLWCIDATKRGDLSPELVYNESAPNVIIPHKRVQACEPEKGDFTRPNPNSGVVWVYNAEDINRDGVIAFQEEFHLSNSLPPFTTGCYSVQTYQGYFIVLTLIPVSRFGHMILWPPSMVVLSSQMEKHGSLTKMVTSPFSICHLKRGCSQKLQWKRLVIRTLQPPTGLCSLRPKRTCLPLVRNSPEVGAGTGDRERAAEAGCDVTGRDGS